MYRAKFTALKFTELMFAELKVAKLKFSELTRGREPCRQNWGNPGEQFTLHHRLFKKLSENPLGKPS